MYTSLADFTEPPRRPVRRRSSGRLKLATVSVLSAVVGMVINAAFLHFGTNPPQSSVVIGENVVRQPVSDRSSQPPSPSRPSPLAWGLPVLVDPSTPLTSVSCPASDFCTAVDGQGRAVQYIGRAWTPPRRIDSTSLTSVSCSGPGFCAAVDREGNALIYDGGTWSAPQRIDRTTFPDLTSVSCSSPTFCAAVDGDGNGFVYNGRRWSSPQEADPQGWTLVSRAVPVVSCPADGLCVGVDQENNVFFYVAGNWQAASTTAARVPAQVSYDNAISCGSSTFCVASQNLGQLIAYNGTQWSLPVAVDPTNFIVSVSCASPTFCAAVDGVLPPGFNRESGGGNGEVVTYDGISWSAPQPVDDAGVVGALSCPDDGFCMLVDESGHAVTGTARQAVTP